MSPADREGLRRRAALLGSSGLAGLAALGLLAAHAQESTGENASREARGVDHKYDEQLIDEIVVRGPGWRLPEPELPETAFRKEEPVVSEPRGRMSFGYDPAEEYELRRNNPVHDLRPGETAPATVFRFRF